MTTAPVTLVYDGDCPVCRTYTRFLAIREAVGQFEILDARDNPPVMAEINARKIDMDEGFVLKVGDEFYHGADAIHALAMLGTNAGLFNRLNYQVFRSRTLSRLFYPVLKTGRSLLLWLLGKTRLHNLRSME